MIEAENNRHLCDLEKHRKTAKTKRQLAWEALKAGQNPTYVAMRYGYDVETMQKAAEKLGNPEPKDIPGARDRRAAARNERGPIKRASEVLPSVTRKQREPGEDDECQHGDDPRRCGHCRPEWEAYQAQ